MINLEELQSELAKMSRRSKLYQVVKAEMQTRGNWKKAPSGKPFKKGYDPNRDMRGLR
jgi:hypothetical protein